MYTETKELQAVGFLAGFSGAKHEEELIIEEGNERGVGTAFEKTTELDLQRYAGLSFEASVWALIARALFVGGIAQRLSIKVCSPFSDCTCLIVFSLTNMQYMLITHTLKLKNSCLLSIP
jgi:ammonia channel protein AmtB